MGNGDVFRLTMEGAYTAESIAVQHVLWFQQTSATPLANEALLLATDFGNEMISLNAGAAWRQVLAPGFTWLSIRCQKMLFDFEEPVTITPSGASTGVGLNGAAEVGVIRIPSTACMVVQLQAERAGRSGMGRIYLGGFCAAVSFGGSFRSTVLDHGRWSSAAIATVQTWLNALRARYNGATVIDVGSGFTAQIGVWSRKLGGQQPPHAVQGFSPLVSALATDIIRTQRRRQFGIGQ